MQTATDQEAAHLEATQTRAYMTKLEDENVRLRNALEELYGATHGYLNVVGYRGRVRAGTPRLNRALGAASEALHGE